MVFKIIWTEKAINDKITILAYWVERNKTKTYAKKLSALLNERVELIAQYPLLGKKTEVKDIRVHVVKDFLLAYKITDKTIYIVSIFDTRQDPLKFGKK